MWNVDARNACQNLDKEVFYEPANQTIFSGLMEMHRKYEQIEWPLLVDHFTRNATLEEIGGKIELDRIWSIFPSYCSLNHSHYLDIVQDNFRRREGIKEAWQLQNNLFDMATESDGVIETHLTKIRQTFGYFNKPVGTGIKVG